MHAIEPLEAGVMFWAERDSVAEMRAMGVRCGQLGLPGGMKLGPEAAAQWKADLEQSGFTLVTVFAAYDGEDYADIPTVQRTVGFIPASTRVARERRTLEVSDFAAALGVGSIACHIGFVPEEVSDPDYIAVRDMVRRVCDHAAAHQQTFALETGQEPAQVLLAFFRDVNRPNLRINFDPANMILYGTGDPIEALEVLAPHVASVHCKDGDWPPKDSPGALGSERPLGTGSVGIPKFVATLGRIGFTGSLNVEREAEDQPTRLRDMRAAVSLLRELTAGLRGVA
jgi:sugar phosphate isomerase/epimerase